MLPLTSSSAVAAAVEAAGVAVAAASSGSQSLPVTPQSTEMPSLPAMATGEFLKFPRLVNKITSRWYVPELWFCGFKIRPKIQ